MMSSTTKAPKQHVYNINNNNTADSVPLLKEIRAKNLVVDRVQGDEPIRYIDLKISREESIQKWFYI